MMRLVLAFARIVVAYPGGRSLWGTCNPHFPSSLDETYGDSYYFYWNKIFTNDRIEIFSSLSRVKKFCFRNQGVDFPVTECAWCKHLIIEVHSVIALDNLLICCQVKKRKSLKNPTKNLVNDAKMWTKKERRRFLSFPASDERKGGWET